MNATKRLNSAADVLEAFAADVRAGLSSTPKYLLPRYFYDAMGSQLFEAICELPWYAITRAETHLLADNARRMIQPIADATTLVELGCGSGEKIAFIVEALRVRGRSLDVHLVDISRKALDLSEQRLKALTGAFPHAHAATYEDGLARAASQRGPGPMLVLFLGSNIGNFDRPAARAFLAMIRRALRPGDGFLLGTDLVKPEAELLLAYADPLGVTAAFNKNVLLRINRELGGNFDLTTFEHSAKWDAEHARVEMHLVSDRAQTVEIGAIGAKFAVRRGRVDLDGELVQIHARRDRDVRRRIRAHVSRAMDRSHCAVLRVAVSGELIAPPPSRGVAPLSRSCVSWRCPARSVRCVARFGS